MSQISIWNHFHDPKILSHPDGLGQNEWAVNLHRKLDQKMASDVRGIHFLKKKNLAIELHISDILPPEY